MKLSTINQIVEGILERDPKETEESVAGRAILSDGGIKRMAEARANAATIILKTADICEHRGIDEAMDYYYGTHNSQEFQEFRTSVVAGGKNDNN